METEAWALSRVVRGQLEVIFGLGNSARSAWTNACYFYFGSDPPTPEEKRTLKLMGFRAKKVRIREV